MSSEKCIKDSREPSTTRFTTDVERLLLWILVPVYNRKNTTLEFIELLKKQTFRNFKLVVVDDGSTDGTGELVMRSLPEAIVVKTSGNLWWSGSLQLGIEEIRKIGASGNDYLLMINDDVKFTADYLYRGLTEVARTQKAVVGSTCLSESSRVVLDPGVRIDWKKAEFSPAKTQSEVNCLSTRGLFLRLGDVEDIGDFRPHILPHYLSDYEFTVRAYQKGWSLLVPSDLVIYTSDKVSGVIDLERLGMLDTIKAIFSRKYTANPVDHTFFMLVTCPWPWKLVNIFWIWADAFNEVFKKLPPPLYKTLKSLIVPPLSFIRQYLRNL